MAEHSTRAVLRVRDVRFFIASRFFSATSSTLVRATVLWQIWELTRSEFQLGISGLAKFVPVLLLALIGGAIADSYDRRRVVILAQIATLLVCAGLFVLSRGGDPPIWAVFAMLAALAATNSIENPSRSALLPSMVPRELLPSAVTLHSTFQNLAWVTGPVAAGFMIDSGGVAAAYGGSVVLVACSIANLLAVRPRPPASDMRAVSAEAVREGISFVWRRPVILGSMTLDMFAVIFASVTAILPVFADQILSVGPRGYGLLSAAIEAGTVLMALVMVVIPPLVRPGRALLFAVVAFGCATILFGVSRSFWLSFAALTLAGMADQVSMVARAIILQLSTPDALRGRVNSVNQIFIGASNDLGTLESGLLAGLTSATFSVVFGGFACLAVLGVLALRVPALRVYRVDSDETPRD